MNPLLLVYLTTCLLSTLALFRFFWECIDVLNDQKYELDEDSIPKEAKGISLPWWLIGIGLASIPVFNLIMAYFIIAYHEVMLDEVIKAMDNYRKR